MRTHNQSNGGQKMKVWSQYILRVRYQETDQMGVAHHANYVSWFEAGRTEWLRNTSLAYSKLEGLGLLLPVVDLDIHYQTPARYDDCLAIYTAIKDLSRARLQFEYEIRRIGDAQSTIPDKDTEHHVTPYGELLASGTTLHMWLNRDWKPARVDKSAPEVYALLQSKLT
jgi:acyl-CoA thioester hydrolase